MHSPEYKRHEHEPSLTFNLRDKLGGFLEKHRPELLDNTIAQQEELKNMVDKRELVVKELGVIDVLEQYGISTEEIKEKNGFWVVPIKKTLPSVKSLPDGYAFKGGAARSLLLRNLGIDTDSQPRDLDVIRLSEAEPTPGSDDLVSREFMSDDYSHGDGVEAVGDVEDYFSTRDFTINEIFADSKSITLTEDCLLDSVRRIIRFSDSKRDSFCDYPSSAMLAKALRLYSDAVANSGLVPEFKAMDDWEFEDYSISPFWLALNMDRAYERGAAVALEFTSQLRAKRQIPPDIGTADEAAVYIFELLGGGNFYYRYAPSSLFVDEDRLKEEFNNESLLPKFEGFGRRSE